MLLLRVSMTHSEMWCDPEVGCLDRGTLYSVPVRAVVEVERIPLVGLHVLIVYDAFLAIRAKTLFEMDAFAAVVVQLVHCREMVLTSPVEWIEAIEVLLSGARTRIELGDGVNIGHRIHIDVEAGRIEVWMCLLVGEIGTVFANPVEVYIAAIVSKQIVPVEELLERGFAAIKAVPFFVSWAWRMP